MRLKTPSTYGAGNRSKVGGWGKIAKVGGERSIALALERSEMYVTYFFLAALFIILVYTRFLSSN